MLIFGTSAKRYRCSNEGVEKNDVVGGAISHFFLPDFSPNWTRNGEKNARPP